MSTRRRRHRSNEETKEKAPKSDRNGEKKDRTVEDRDYQKENIELQAQVKELNEEIEKLKKENIELKEELNTVKSVIAVHNQQLAQKHSNETDNSESDFEETDDTDDIENNYTGNQRSSKIINKTEKENLTSSDKNRIKKKREVQLFQAIPVLHKFPLHLHNLTLQRWDYQIPLLQKLKAQKNLTQVT